MDTGDIVEVMAAQGRGEDEDEGPQGGDAPGSSSGAESGHRRPLAEYGNSRRFGRRASTTALGKRSIGGTTEMLIANRISKASERSRHHARRKTLDVIPKDEAEKDLKDCFGKQRIFWKDSFHRHSNFFSER